MQHIEKLNLHIENACVERSSINRWLLSPIQKLGIPVICVDAKHIAAILSLKVNRTDKHDARGKANALRGGSIKGPLKGSGEFKHRVFRSSEAKLRSKHG